MSHSQVRARIRRVAACAGLGAATTIAVSWVLASQVSLRFASEMWYTAGDFGNPPAWVTDFIAFGSCRREWTAQSTPFDSAQILHRDRLAAFAGDAERARLEHDARVPRWGIVPETPPKPFARIHAIEDARGWPRLAMRCIIDYDSARDGSINRWRISDGFLLPWSDPPFNTAAARIVPIHPIWPGFAFNTAVYGLAWMLAMQVIGVAVRALRIQRGRCPRCGYDLKWEHKSGCPECGWNRSAGLFVATSTWPPLSPSSPSPPPSTPSPSARS